MPRICGNCAHYQPSPYSPESGNGGCKAMKDWLGKHKERGTKPSDKAVKDVYLELGGTFGTPSAIYHPKSDRKRCKKYIQKKKP